MFERLSWLIAKCSHFIVLGATFLDTFARAKVGTLETRGSILVTFSINIYDYGMQANLVSLWIKGVPGAGKSVIAASMMEHLKSIDNAPVPFFSFPILLLRVMVLPAHF
jgi:hypothetical protein